MFTLWVFVYLPHLLITNRRNSWLYHVIALRLWAVQINSKQKVTRWDVLLCKCTSVSLVGENSPSEKRSSSTARSFYNVKYLCRSKVVFLSCRIWKMSSFISWTQTRRRKIQRQMPTKKSKFGVSLFFPSFFMHYISYTDVNNVEIIADTGKTK